MLDAVSGAVVWSRNAASDVHAKTPMWGFSSSPLVVGDVVIVAAGGKLAAYDVATGALRWTGGGGGFSYSSPHLATIDGVEQVVFISGPGTTSIAPATGKVLWEHAWEGGAIVQPALTDRWRRPGQHDLDERRPRAAPHCDRAQVRRMDGVRALDVESG